MNFETLLDFALIGLEIVIGVFLLFIWFMPESERNEILNVKGDTDAN
jgi:hypothetical protein